MTRTSARRIECAISQCESIAGCRDDASLDALLLDTSCGGSQTIERQIGEHHSTAGGVSEVDAWPSSSAADIEEEHSTLETEQAHKAVRLLLRRVARRTIVGSNDADLGTPHRWFPDHAVTSVDVLGRVASFLSHAFMIGTR